MYLHCVCEELKLGREPQQNVTPLTVDRVRLPSLLTTLPVEQQSICTVAVRPRDVLSLHGAVAVAVVLVAVERLRLLAGHLLVPGLLLL